MKLLMVASEDILAKNSIGVFKKMVGQAKAFIANNIDVDFIYNKSYSMIFKNIKDNKDETIRPNSTRDRYNKILKIIENNNYDVVYIRYSLSDYYFLDFLQNVKNYNSRIKILIDFPTYPYEQEMKNDKELLNIDKFFRSFIQKFVDFGTCYNELDEIFSVPVLNIGNGIEIDSIEVKNKLICGDDLNLIGVANLSIWHGYDRVILGLRDYYKNNSKLRVNFHIIGVGSELSNLKAIVVECNLNKYVKFHGAKQGEELLNVFNDSHIAIGSLGMHRIDLKDGSTLKVREYCARGIPFLIGYEDLDFLSDFKYALKISNDDSNININAIIEFYNTVYEDKDLAGNMRKYAEKNLTWEAKLKPVIDKIT